jgi:hypothetical protein
MNAVLSAHAVGLVVAAVDPAKVKPGWVAGVIVLLLGLATYLLWRSMNRQLKKVHFDDGGPGGAVREGGARGGDARGGGSRDVGDRDGEGPDRGTAG